MFLLHNFDIKKDIAFRGRVHQMFLTLKFGLWYARSQEVRHSPVFQTLLKGRALGGHVFVWGGLLPLVYFVVARMWKRRPCTPSSAADGKCRSTWFIGEAHDDSHAKKA